MDLFYKKSELKGNLKTIYKKYFPNFDSKNKDKKNSSLFETSEFNLSMDSVDKISDLIPISLIDISKLVGLPIESNKNFYNDVLSEVQKFIGKNNYLNLPKNKLANLSKVSTSLVNLSKRNRMIYSKKITSNYSMDLFEIFSSLEINKIMTKLINNKNVEINLNEHFINNKNKSVSKNWKKYISKINSLYEKYRFEYLEKGTKSLFISFPFIRGRLLTSDIDVTFKNSPLCFFPMSLKKRGYNFYLSNDIERDLMLNSLIFLLFDKNSIVKKEEKLREYLNNNIKEKGLKEFYEFIIELYKNSNLNIEERKTFRIQKDLNKNLPETRRKFEIDCFISIGIYNVSTYSIYNDLQNIVKQKKINKLLSNVISERDVVSGKEKKSEKSINDLFLINNLNYSQSEIIKKTSNREGVVVQGPPGTGKSELISSLISDSISEGKKVLVLSKKKSALDVINDRISEGIRKYSLYVSDEKQKSNFYSQILNTNLTSKDIILDDKKSNNTKLNSYSKNLEEYFDKFNEVELFMKKDNLGKENRYLYLEYENLNKNNSRFYEIFVELEIINELEKLNTKGGKIYPEIMKIKNKFNDFSVFSDHSNSLQFVEKSLINFDKSISKSNLSNFEAKSNELQIQITKLKDNFLNYSKESSFFEKEKYKKNIKIILKGYGFKWSLFKKNSKEYIENIDEFKNNYKKIIRFLKLNKLEREWIRTARVFFQKDINTIDGIKKMQKINRIILNCVISFYLTKMEEESNIIDILDKFEIFQKNIRGIEISRIKKNKKNISGYLEKKWFSGMKITNRKNLLVSTCESKEKPTLRDFFKNFWLEIYNSYNLFLMSPEVVSSILPLVPNLFDLLIVDEASQMLFVESLPSIFRSKKFLVAGDSKQLKPSRFGIFSIPDDNDEEDSYFEDLFVGESLLETLKNKYENFLLNYHYRSKYETLINFSNVFFYEGKLLVSSPKRNINNFPAIEWKYIPNGIWKDRTNIKEAKSVVDLLIEKRRNSNFEKKIGVITFNSSQKELIDKEILNRNMNESDHSKIFNPNFYFVKNIENVQGDETDIIIFSITYAKDSSGKVSSRFGWLNNDGGDNRLNVAITRAKEKIIVVSSLMPDELNVSSSKNRGPKLFKEYLRYAKAVHEGDKDTINVIFQNKFLLGSKDDDQGSSNDINGELINKEGENKSIELQVYEALKGEGFSVDYKVGVSNYKIDVAIKDRYSGDYILGIECDGNSYYDIETSPRERDYERKKYLELRGWNIYRVWGRNWWDDKNKEIRKIISMIREIQKRNS